MLKDAKLLTSLSLRGHNTKAMGIIRYEEKSFYIFYRGYNTLSYFLTLIVGAGFVILRKAKKDFKLMKRKSSFSPKSCNLSDAVAYKDD